MQAHDPTPDALQAPWRLDYLEAMENTAAASGQTPPGMPGANVATPGKTSAGGSGSSGSFLLDYWRDPASDERNHVIVRTGGGLILLNGFPYAAGHLLVALGEARPTLLDYEPDLRRRLWELVDAAMDLMLIALKPQGVNVGFNQGRAAGAGVPQHLHVHLVPRWGGDVNFMSTIGQIRVIPASLERMAEKLRAAWAVMGGVEGWEARQGVKL